ncbi:MAG: DUF4912 domain-containing protein [Candidatus Eisenbacteria bacterium]
MTKKELLSAAKRDLLARARDLRIRGRTSMTKEQLAAAIVKASKQEGVGGSSETMPGGGPGPQKRRGTPIRERTLVRRSWREQQALVQHAKYEAESGRAVKAPPEPMPEPHELPPAYGGDRIVLLVRDPYWLHVYWEISRDTLLNAKKILREEWETARSVLRVYDVTGVDFDGNNAESFFDIEIDGGANNWYVNTGVPNRTYCIEIGLLSKSGKFVMLARSNKATTPRDAPSDVSDEEWMIPDWQFEQIYALSGGFSVGTGSAELKEMMEKALGQALSSGAPSSFAVSSPGMGAEAGVRARGFWFRLGTELIVYGATEPDAKVTLQGRPIKLRPDGTFTVRMDLPDGEQVIPAVAVSADGIDTITITPTVSKKTKK